MTIDDVFYRKVLLWLLSLRAWLAYAFLSPLLRTLLLEFLKIQRLFPIFLTFFCIKYLKFTDSLLPLLQPLFFLLMLGLQALQNLSLLPYLIDQLSQLDPILIFFLLLDHLLLLPLDYRQVFDILIEFFDMFFLLLDIVFHLNEIIRGELVLTILFLQILEFILIIFQHNPRVFQFLLQLFLQFFLVNPILGRGIHILGHLFFDSLLELLDVVGQFGLLTFQPCDDFILLLDLLQESCNLVLLILHNKLIYIIKGGRDNQITGVDSYLSLISIKIRQIVLSCILFVFLAFYNLGSPIGISSPSIFPNLGGYDDNSII